MDPADLFLSRFQRTIERSGEVTLVIVSLLLAGDFFKIIEINNFGVPFLGLILWAYLLLNVGLVNMFKFLKNKDNPTCPKCHKRLSERKEYTCSRCGDLKFSKKSSQ